MWGPVCVDGCTYCYTVCGARLKSCKMLWVLSLCGHLRLEVHITKRACVQDWGEGHGSEGVGI